VGVFLLAPRISPCTSEMWYTLLVWRSTPRRTRDEEDIEESWLTFTIAGLGFFPLQGPEFLYRLGSSSCAPPNKRPQSSKARLPPCVYLPFPSYKGVGALFSSPP